MNTKTNKGFSLIELLVALSILAVVAAIIVPRFLNVRTQASAATARASLQEFQNIARQFVSLGGTINGTATASDLLFVLNQSGRAAGYAAGAGAAGTNTNKVVDSTAATLGSNTLVFPAIIQGTTTAANATTQTVAGFYTTSTPSATASGGALYYSAGNGVDAWLVVTDSNGNLTTSRTSTGTNTTAITLN
jgi:prepilin-type N-terminal cleavage/methylation domain-containing protein